jgi:hypothetical protein
MEVRVGLEGGGRFIEEIHTPMAQKIRKQDPLQTCTTDK